jgi:nucleoside-diphosphate-sugar epimerase
VLAECDAAVHCAADVTSPDHWELDRRTVETLLAAAAAPGGPQKIVYTSGVWLYGDTGNGIVSEGSAPNPPEFVLPRLEIERRVLAASRGGVRTLVLRPGCVYGGRGGLTGMWFDSAEREGAARVIGDGSTRWTMVHLDDLADAYLRAVDAPWGGEVFNVTDRSRFTVAECARAAARAAGAGERIVEVSVEEASQQLGPMAAALAFNQHVDSRKAVRMLGWQPRQAGFVDGAERYYLSWKAATSNR